MRVVGSTQSRLFLGRTLKLKLMKLYMKSTTCENGGSRLSPSKKSMACTSGSNKYSIKAMEPRKMNPDMDESTRE